MIADLMSLDFKQLVHATLAFLGLGVAILTLTGAVQ